MLEEQLYFFLGNVPFSPKFSSLTPGMSVLEGCVDNNDITLELTRPCDIRRAYAERRFYGENR